MLYENYALNFSNKEIDKNLRIKNHRLMFEYNIWLEDNSEKVDAASIYIIEIDLPKSILSKNNICVYQKHQNGTFSFVSSKIDAETGKIIITANSLGDFYIAVEDDKWMDTATMISVFVLMSIIIFVKYKRNKKMRLK